MRFTSVFISTFVTAPVVLALSNVAGVILTERSANFNLVSASIEIPHLSCGTAQIVYAGIALGDPSTCGSTFEVGVAFRCDTSSVADEPYYTAVMRTHPNNPVACPSVPIHEGDAVFVSIALLSDGIFGLILNGESSTGWVPAGKGAESCRSNVLWFLKLDSSDGDLIPIPQFDPFTISNTVARDDANNMYTASDGEKRDMTGRIGADFATASVSGDTITINWANPGTSTSS